MPAQQSEKKAGLSRKQMQILAFPNSKYSALICDGSIRAGKSSVMSLSFLLWAMRDFNGQNFAICSKTIQTAVKNVVKPLISMAYVRDRFAVTFKSAASAEGTHLIVTNGRHTNTFYVYGGKDERSYQLIQGITLAGVLLDEVALMPRSFVEQALARCSVTGRRLWFNCNPEGSQHWFNREWVMCPEKHNALRLHFTMDDNPALSADVRREYESMYSGSFYDRYIRGLWVSAEGLIYDMFDDGVHVLDDEPETEGDWYSSSDFGIQNATTFLLWRKIKGKDEYLCVDEWVYSGRDERRQKSVSELVDGFESMIGNREPSRTIIDPSAAALKVELKQRGHRVQDADNDVLDGISDVSTMLSKNKLFFMRRCKHTIEEFGQYIWDAKAADRGQDVPVKQFDHCMDAVRYFVRTRKLVKHNNAKPYKSPFF